MPAKHDIRRSILTVSVLLLAVLTIFSVIGAFAGPYRAKVFFNSLPLAIFWLALLLLLLVSFFVFPSLRKRTMSLLVHVGLGLVLAGGMAGSQKGHALFNHFASQPRIVRGTFLLAEGQTANLVDLDNGQTFELPFAVQLKKAVVEYYPGSLMPKDYKSDLEILVNGFPVKQGQIEVNKPLAYGGYHLYQNTFVEGDLPLSGILVVSSQGIRLVFAGYAFIAIGLFWNFGRILFLAKPSAETVDER